MVNDINNFRVRNLANKTSINDIYLKGADAVIQYIKNKSQILKNELWFDYDFGLDIRNLSVSVINFWIRDVLDELKFISKINTLNIKQQDNNARVFIIELSITLNNNVILNNNFNLNF